MDENEIGIKMIMEMHKGVVHSPYHWEMGLSEMGLFLFKWGWALNVKPPLI